MTKREKRAAFRKLVKWIEDSYGRYLTKEDFDMLFRLVEPRMPINTRRGFVLLMQLIRQCCLQPTKVVDLHAYARHYGVIAEQWAAEADAEAVAGLEAKGIYLGYRFGLPWKKRPPQSPYSQEGA